MTKPSHAIRLGPSQRLRRRHEAQTEFPSEQPTFILIVVEDHLAGRHLARLLASKGYERVRVVRRAASALIVAEKCSPAIVFLDVELSDDAYSLANALRQQAGRRTLRLIALTSSIEHSTREQARGAGFERWLVTPVEEEELDSLMRREVAAPG